MVRGRVAHLVGDAVEVDARHVLVLLLGCAQTELGADRHVVRRLEGVRDGGRVGEGWDGVDAGEGDAGGLVEQVVDAHAPRVGLGGRACGVGGVTHGSEGG